MTEERLATLRVKIETRSGPNVLDAETRDDIMRLITSALRTDAADATIIHVELRKGSDQ